MEIDLNRLTTIELPGKKNRNGNEQKTYLTMSHKTPGARKTQQVLERALSDTRSCLTRYYAAAALNKHFGFQVNAEPA